MARLMEADREAGRRVAKPRGLAELVTAGIAAPAWPLAVSGAITIKNASTVATQR